MVRVIAYTSFAVAFCTAAAPLDERDQLLEDFGKWKGKHGAKAVHEGWLPKADNLNDNEKTDLYLNRIRDAKKAVAQLKATNPQAEFDYLNQFALLNQQEFADLVGKSRNLDDSLKRLLRTENAEAPEAIPASMDWSTYKCVNPIKNQGQCGSCWAFAATSTLESAHCIKTGVLLNLSEQQLVSCDTKSFGCNGGYDYYAMQNAFANGQCLSSAYPYTSGSNGVTGTCKTTCTKNKLTVGSIIVSGPAGEVNLRNRIAIQPVSVHVYAVNVAFQYYSSGILSSCPQGTSDYAVVALGYGNENGINYFKLRNSWGTSWGESGYIRLANGGTSGIGACNVAQYVYYPSLV